jgi:hypothetical protein
MGEGEQTSGYEVSNLAAFGWEWHSGTSMMQLIALRGIRGPMTFSVKPDGSDEWTSTRCDDKWTCDGTHNGFLRVVREFMAEGGE